MGMRGLVLIMMTQKVFNSVLSKNERILTAHQLIENAVLEDTKPFCEYAKEYAQGYKVALNMFRSNAFRTHVYGQLVKLKGSDSILGWIGNFEVVHSAVGDILEFAIFSIDKHKPAKKSVYSVHWKELELVNPSVRVESIPDWSKEGVSYKHVLCHGMKELTLSERKTLYETNFKSFSEK